MKAAISIATTAIGTATPIPIFALTEGSPDDLFDSKVGNRNPVVIVIAVASKKAVLIEPFGIGNPVVIVITVNQRE
jgi:hypothetical protein